MTIWFHEGLPRSGKSYEAMVKHALPAIAAGRHVVTNIKGVDCEKIAEVLALPVQEVESLVTLIPWDSTKDCITFVQNDCLLLLDEVQDFWPATRERLSRDITELITQHGQRGIDIILMGQTVSDCHNLWKRRVDKLVYFVQKDCVGKPLEYQWVLSKRVSADKFAEVTKGPGKYESKYFGIYKSHVDGATNKEAYQDIRANVWNRKALKYGFPAAAVVAVLSFAFLYYFFTAPSVFVNTAVAGEIKKPPLIAAVEQPAVVDPLPVVNVAPVVDLAETEKEPLDYLEALLRDFRPRLSAYIQSGERLSGRIEFYRGDGFNRREVLDFNAIRGFGWTVEVKDYGVALSKGDKVYSVTSWPIDLIGQVPQVIRQSELITGREG